ncbi:hypothetical protein E8E11_000172, partial [Didymella keratinophila]
KETLQDGEEIDINDVVQNKRLNRRLDLRVLPLCCWVYLLNFLDRGNIGNARVLNAETNDNILQVTGLTPHGYALTVTLFSVAYAVFEIPSNWVMKHYIRPSMWLGILLFAWGALTIGFAGVQNTATIIALRFLIGVFEARFFPGIVYFITIWYRWNERAVRIALVIAFCNLAGAFGGAIAYGVGHINGASGLEGFSGYNQQHATRKEILDTCFSPRMLLHYIAYIADVVPQGSFTFFTPTIVTGLGYESIHAQLLTVPPWVVGFFVAITISYTADKFNARGWTITIFSLIGGAGWLTAGLLPADAYVQRYGCLCLAAAGAFPCAPSLTNWVTCDTPSFLTLPLAIAVNNSCAGVGQIIAQ